MSGIRNSLCFLLAVVLAALALPSVAGNDKKQVNVMLNAPSGQTTAPFTVNATVTNKGNSTISSFSLTVIFGQTVVGVVPAASGKATFTASTVSVKNMSPLKSGDSFMVQILMNTCGDSHWGATAWTGSQLNGQSFGLDLLHSQLDSSAACGPAVAAGGAFNVPVYQSPPCVTGERGSYDKDGTSGNPVEFFVTNLLSGPNGVLHFRWPDGAGAGNDASAAWEYTVCASLTSVAWLNDQGGSASTGNPVFVPAQDCIEPNQLPTPYGTLAADLFAGDTTTISVNTAAPAGTIPYPGSQPTDPNHSGSEFDLVIGSERITVKLVCLDNEDNDPDDPNDCTETDEGEGEALKIVQRGARGTQAADHIGPNILVMSTPLPVQVGPYSAGQTAAGYAVGNQALMCISRHPDEEDSSTTFFDIGGDGWHAP